jgi:hypothetical protein
VKRVITIFVCIAVAASFAGCKSAKAQNEVRWNYKAVLTTKKVDVAKVYNTVRGVLNEENIPNFTTQGKNKYTIETEWLGIRRGRDAFVISDSPAASPENSWHYPTYVKYYVSIDKKGYTMSAVTTSGGIQWVSYDMSYKPNQTVDVLPQSENWDNLIRLTRQINVNLKYYLDGQRYAESFTGPGSTRPYYSGSSHPVQDQAWAYPELTRSTNSYNSTGPILPSYQNDPYWNAGDGRVGGGTPGVTESYSTGQSAYTPQSSTPPQNRPYVPAAPIFPPNTTVAPSGYSAVPPGYTNGTYAAPPGYSNGTYAAPPAAPASGTYSPYLNGSLLNPGTSYAPAPSYNGTGAPTAAYPAAGNGYTGGAGYAPNLGTQTNVANPSTLSANPGTLGTGQNAANPIVLRSNGWAPITGISPATSTPWEYPSTAANNLGNIALPVQPNGPYYGQR